MILDAETENMSDDEDSLDAPCKTIVLHVGDQKCSRVEGARIDFRATIPNTSVVFGCGHR